VIFAVNKHARTKCDACGVFGGWNAADPFTDRPAHETARAHSRWHGWVMYRCEDGCDLDLCASCATFARTEEPPHGSECPQRAPQGGSAIEVRDARATIRGEFAGEHAAPYRADAGGWRYSFEDISRTIERIAARMPPRPEPTPHARAVDAVRTLVAADRALTAAVETYEAACEKAAESMKPLGYQEQRDRAWNEGAEGHWTLARISVLCDGTHLRVPVEPHAERCVCRECAVWQR
jgi:phosphoribosyl-AMP cyclohydrolase